MNFGVFIGQLALAAVLIFLAFLGQNSRKKWIEILAILCGVGGGAALGRTIVGELARSVASQVWYGATIACVACLGVILIDYLGNKKFDKPTLAAMIALPVFAVSGWDELGALANIVAGYVSASFSVLFLG